MRQQRIGITGPAITALRESAHPDPIQAAERQLGLRITIKRPRPPRRSRPSHGQSACLAERLSAPGFLQRAPHYPQRTELPHQSRIKRAGLKALNEQASARAEKANHRPRAQAGDHRWVPGGD